MPKLTHPESGQTIEVSPSQVEVYESQGWQQSKPSK